MLLLWVTTNIVLVSRKPQSEGWSWVNLFDETSDNSGDKMLETADAYGEVLKQKKTGSWDESKLSTHSCDLMLNESVSYLLFNWTVSISSFSVIFHLTSSASYLLSPLTIGVMFLIEVSLLKCFRFALLASYILCFIL